MLLTNDVEVQILFYFLRLTYFEFANGSFAVYLAVFGYNLVSLLHTLFADIAVGNYAAY